MDICKKSKLTDRNITLGEKVILTSVKSVGQEVRTTSMSDLAKTINCLSEMAPEGRVFIPKIWETFGEYKLVLDNFFQSPNFSSPLQY